MRNLPTKRSQEQETIIRAVQDFWNEDKITRRVIQVALWIMGRHRGLAELTKEEKEAVWYVQNNLTDKRYCSSLLVL